MGSGLNRIGYLRVGWGEVRAPYGVIICTPEENIRIEDNTIYEWKVESQSFLRNAISWIGYRNKSEGITAGHGDWNS